MHVTLEFLENVTSWTVGLQFDEIIDSYSIWDADGVNTDDDTTLKVDSRNYQSVQTIGNLVTFGMNLHNDGTECASLSCININGQNSWVRPPTESPTMAAPTTAPTSMTMDCDYTPNANVLPTPEITNEWPGGCSLNIHLYFTQAVTSWTVMLNFNEHIGTSSIWNVVKLDSPDPDSVIVIENTIHSGVQNSGANISFGMNLGNVGNECASLSCISVNGEVGWTSVVPTTTITPTSAPTAYPTISHPTSTPTNAPSFSLAASPDSVVVLIEDGQPGSINLLQNDQGTIGSFTIGLNVPMVSFPCISDGGRMATCEYNVTGNFMVVPGSAFDDLATGQADTVTLPYEISNPEETDASTITIQIIGFGSSSALATTTQSTPNTNQEVTIQMDGDSSTTDGNGAIDMLIRFGAVVQPFINVIYVVDTSGSTIASVLDQEVSALVDLTSALIALGYPEGSVTVSIVPFSTVSSPDATGDDVSTITLDTTDDTTTDEDLTAITAALNDLSGGGFTNYLLAINAANNLVDTLPSGTNIVYFLSDGTPTIRDNTGRITTQTVADITAASAELRSKASISAFEIGNVNALEFLDAIDNTGGTESVDGGAGLSTAVLGSPIPHGTIVAARIIVTVPTASSQTINIDLPGQTPTGNPIMIETALGIEIDFVASGLNTTLGAKNSFELIVELDDNGDNVTDITLSSEISIYGYNN